MTRGGFDEGQCFNHNCHNIYAKVDQIVQHTKDVFVRGQGILGCQKCCLAVTQALASKELSQPPNNCCKICAGVNGNTAVITLLANGEQYLWVCHTCAELQVASIQANFFLIQTSVPQREAEEFYTYDLPTDPPPKKRPRSSFASNSGDESLSPPPFRRKITKLPTYSTGKSMSQDSSITVAVNQQEKIVATIEQLQILQKQQELNLKNIQSYAMSLSDYDAIRDANISLSEQVANLTKSLEEQRNTGQPLAERIKEEISNLNHPNTQPIINLVESLLEVFATPINPIVQSNNVETEPVIKVDQPEETI